MFYSMVDSRISVLKKENLKKEIRHANMTILAMMYKIYLKLLEIFEYFICKSGRPIWLIIADALKAKS